MYKIYIREIIEYYLENKHFTYKYEFKDYERIEKNELILDYTPNYSLFKDINKKLEKYNFQIVDLVFKVGENYSEKDYYEPAVYFYKPHTIYIQSLDTKLTEDIIINILKNEINWNNYSDYTVL